VKVKFIVERTTANMVRYRAEEPEPGQRAAVIGTIYLSKEAAKDQAFPGQAYPEYLYLDIQAG
jgi:hypothetical protein